MTVVCGVVGRDGVWIGGDAYLGANGVYRVQSEPKVFERAGIMIGTSGDARFAQLLRHQLEVPKRGRMGRDAFMVGPFIDAVRVLLKAKGYSKTDSGREEWDHACALIGFEGRLWAMWGDMQIGPVKDYAAIGAGMEPALGALHATEHVIVSPYARVKAALEASAAHCAMVCPPFKILFQARV